MMFGLPACAANNGVNAMPVNVKAAKNAFMITDQTVRCDGRLRALPGSPATNPNLGAPALAADEQPVCAPVAAGPLVQIREGRILFGLRNQDYSFSRETCLFNKIEGHWALATRRLPGRGRAYRQ
jgi:hypothetical protein